MWVEEAVREVSADILLLHVLLYFISPICKCVLACSFHGCPCAHGCVWQITVTARCQVHLDGNMVTICSERLFQLHLWRRVALWWKCHVFVWLLCYVRCIFAFFKSRKYKKKTLRSNYLNITAKHTHPFMIAVHPLIGEIPWTFLGVTHLIVQRSSIT